MLWIFAHLDEKHNLLEILRQLSKIFKNFLRKLQKIMLAYFSKKFMKPCVNFSRVWTKNTNFGDFWENLENFWWKFYRKIVFYIFIFLENFLRKIEPSEITPFFYIFSVGGGFPPSPLATPLSDGYVRQKRIPKIIEKNQMKRMPVNWVRRIALMKEIISEWFG